MKGFGSICRYELKKILTQKSLWVAVIVLLYWSISCGVKAPTDASYVERLQSSKEAQLSITGENIDDDMLEKVYALQINGELIESAYWEIGEYVISLITQDANGSFDIPVNYGGETALYESRTNWLDSRWKAQELSDAETAYWLNCEDALDTPFTYSYSDNYFRNIHTIDSWFVVHIIVISLCLCLVFSDEFRCRTDQLIFSSVNGKKILYKAKMLSGLGVALILTIIALAARTAAMGVNYGFEGFNAQIQLLYPTSSLNFSLGEAMLILYGLVIAATCLIACFVMVLSLITANGVAALAVPVGIVIANLFLESPTERLAKQVYSYFPVIKIQETLFSDNLLVGIGSMQFNTVEFAFILYFMLAGALLIIGQFYWNRLQAASK